MCMECVCACVYEREREKYRPEDYFRNEFYPFTIDSGDGTWVIRKNFHLWNYFASLFESF